MSVTFIIIGLESERNFDLSTKGFVLNNNSCYVKYIGFIVNKIDDICNCRLHSVSFVYLVCFCVILGFFNDFLIF